MDAKCKLPIGEPGYPIAVVARGKKVIADLNEKLLVTDHDFSKLSIIPLLTYCMKFLKRMN